MSALLFFIALVLTALLVTSETIRVTNIGDSITEGGGCAPDSYVDILRNILGSGYEVTNAGKSSMTMLKKGLCNDLTPCSYWDTDAWQTALNSKPDIVTIMLGTNDAKYFNWEGIQQNLGDYYGLDYADMALKLRGLRPIPDVYVLVPPPLYDPYPFDMNATIINQIFPVLVRDVGAVVHAGVIDIYSAILGSNMTTAELTCDGCHPTDAANQIIAQTIADVIVSSKKK
jgi:lysophospholipase L1-like esterase